MARITVEDCIEKVDNRFELVMLAARRARMLSGGAPLTVEHDNDKNAVLSLREIAGETVFVHELREGFIKSMQKYVEVDDLDDEPGFGDDLSLRDNSFSDASLPHNKIKPDAGFLGTDNSRSGTPSPYGEEEDFGVDETFARAQKQGFGGMSFDDIIDAKD